MTNAERDFNGFEIGFARSFINLTQCIFGDSDKLLCRKNHWTSQNSGYLGRCLCSSWIWDWVILIMFLDLCHFSLIVFRIHAWIPDHILSQSSGNFDPEALPELKKPPDQSKISIQRKLCISIRTKMMLKSYIKKWSGDFNSWSGTRFHWSGEKILVFRMTEVGRFINQLCNPNVILLSHDSSQKLKALIRVTLEAKSGFGKKHAKN